mmetsp:Transcript_16513/g.31032  ORF Transcript_16513/g.31032 Transcript_16513/m.31032 type:complete len:306 (+) Transcript_16513:65-982(+)
MAAGQQRYPKIANVLCNAALLTLVLCTGGEAFILHPNPLSGLRLCNHPAQVFMPKTTDDWGVASSRKLWPTEIQVRKRPRSLVFAEGEKDGDNEAHQDAKAVPGDTAMTVVDKALVVCYRISLVSTGCAMLADCLLKLIKTDLGLLTPEFLSGSDFVIHSALLFTIFLAGLSCRFETTAGATAAVALSTTVAGSLCAGFFLPSGGGALAGPLASVGAPAFLALLGLICLREIAWFGLEYKVEAALAVAGAAGAIVLPEVAPTAASVAGWAAALSVALLGAAKAFEPLAEDFRRGGSEFLKDDPLL